MDTSTLYVLICIKLMMILLEWIRVPYIHWCVSTSYDIIGMDTSTLCALICIQLVMILLEWIRVLCVQRYRSIN